MIFKKNIKRIKQCRLIFTAFFDHIFQECQYFGHDCIYFILYYTAIKYCTVEIGNNHYNTIINNYYNNNLFQYFTVCNIIIFHIIFRGQYFFPYYLFWNCEKCTDSAESTGLLKNKSDTSRCSHENCFMSNRQLKFSDDYVQGHDTRVQSECLTRVCVCVCTANAAAAALTDSSSLQADEIFSSFLIQQSPNGICLLFSALH